MYEKTNVHRSYITPSHRTSECCHQDKNLSLEEEKHPYIAFTFSIPTHFTKFMEQESQNELIHKNQRSSNLQTVTNALAPDNLLLSLEYGDRMGIQRMKI